MSTDTFVPEVWAAELLESLKKRLVFGMVVNRDYEGEINEQGDTVTINSIGRPAINDYTPGSTDIDPEQLSTAQRKLRITESKYFAFEVDDVDARQAAGSMLDAGIREAGFGLGDVADQFLAGLYTDVVSANDLGTISVVEGTPADAYDKILVPLAVALDDASVPEEGRWCVIPPWFHGRLLRDDRFIRADATGDAEAASIRGFIGQAAGFNLFKSNNAPNPTGDDYVVQAGYPGAISYAEQIRKVEAYRPDDSFSDAVKGLHLYGGKLIRPDGIAVATASQT